MKSNLTLITTENFGDLSYNFYRNTSNDVLLTREQIGQALEYSNPIKAIQKIHLKHKDRLEPLCIRTVENRMPQNGGAGVDVETIYYTQRGVMEICRWSRQPKANKFMDWVWDIVEKYRKNELSQSIDITPITEAIFTMTQSITTLASNVIQMQQDIQIMKEESFRKKLPEKKYSHWKTDTFAKLNTLLSYVNENSDENLTLSKIIHLVITETEDTYDIEINDYVAAYKSEFCLDTNPYAIDVISHYKGIKDMFTLTLNSILEKLNLTDISKTKRTNIFDELAAQLQDR